MIERQLSGIDGNIGNDLEGRTADIQPDTLLHLQNGPADASTTQFIGSNPKMQVLEGELTKPARTIHVGATMLVDPHRMIATAATAEVMAEFHRRRSQTG